MNKIYARFLPGKPDAKRYGGMALRRKTTVPDEHGVPRTWDSGDARWTEISPEHARILESHRVQPWRRGMPPDFEVQTAVQVEAKAKDERARQNAVRGVPGLHNVRRFDSTGLDGQQGIPESEVEPAPDPRDIEIAELRERNAATEAKLDKLLAALSNGAKPEAAPEPELTAAIDEQVEPAAEPEKPEEDTSGAITGLMEIRGIGAKSAQALLSAGIRGVEDLANAEPSSVAAALTNVPGLTERRCARWVSIAKGIVSTPSEE